MMEIAKLGSPKTVFPSSRANGNELRFCGVNVNLSPCTDIFIDPNCNVIGDRSFGRTKEVVSEFASSAVRGLQASGVFACIKHFPGHGNTSIDSHEDLPTINDSLEVILNRDLFPFKRAAKSKSGFVMMAHLNIPALDNKFMTTVSRKAYELCRKELRFSGVILTDDMEMGAIEKNYGRAEAAEQAIVAGATMVEYRSYEKTNEVVDELSSKEDLSLIVRENVKIISSVKNSIKSSGLVDENVFQRWDFLNNEIREALRKIKH